MPLPTFLIIGAQKCGTTSLAYYLSQHPSIFMCWPKEPRFFALEGGHLEPGGPSDRKRGAGRGVTTLDAYLALFQGVRQETAIGEASVRYLESEQAPHRIQHHIPSARLIAVLRDPVDRAYSGYLHLIREGREPLRDFLTAFEAEESRYVDRRTNAWAYRTKGFYARHLRRYLSLFDRDQMLILLYDDFRDHPMQVLSELFRFLNVDDTFVPNTTQRFERTGIPRIRLLHRALDRAQSIEARLPIGFEALRRWNLVRPPLLPGVRRQLVEVYREDVMDLQELLGRDLSHWLRA